MLVAIGGCRAMSTGEARCYRACTWVAIASAFYLIGLAAPAAAQVPATDKWGWPGQTYEEACPWNPKPGAAEKACGTEGTHHDRPIVIFLSGICNEDKSQVAMEDDGETDGQLIDYWSQYRGEGIPLRDFENGVSFGDATLGAKRGAEMGQLILNDAEVLNATGSPVSAARGWDSIANGEAVFYRIPWMCWRGFNAGAFQVAAQIDAIITAEFSSVEAAVRTSGAKYNPRQVFIVAHSAGGLVTRTLLSNWGDFDANRATIPLPVSSPKRQQLELLFNDPGALAGGQADAEAIGGAAPSTPLTQQQIQEFMERSIRIRRHVAGAVLLTSPLYGSPVTRLSSTRTVKALSGGLPSAMMMDEDFVAELHQPGGVLDDRMTYPSSWSMDIVPSDPNGAGIPVLLVAGSSSEPQTKWEDFGVGDAALDMQLFPIIDRWIAQHRWREPLASLCEEIAPLTCDAVAVGSSPLLEPLTRELCGAIMDIGAGPKTIGEYSADACGAALWIGNEPAGMLVSIAEGNPFEMLANGASCDAICAHVDGRVELKAFCDAGCSCVLEDGCEIDNPLTWWCCPDEVVDEITSWADDNIGGFDSDSLRNQVCDGLFCDPCDDSFCRETLGFSRGWCAVGDLFVDPVPDCISCQACDASDIKASDVVTWVKDNTDIEIPGGEQINAWENLTRPQDWVVADYDNVRDLLDFVCPLIETGVINPPEALGRHEARYGKKVIEAVCETLRNADPLYLENGWAGDMFADSRVGDVPTTCTEDLDQVRVSYEQVLAIAGSEAAEARFNLQFQSHTDLRLNLPFEWSDVYETEADLLFDNDVVVPTWSELMCSSTADNFAAPQNVARYVAYASHETGKHSDEVAKVVAEWMYPRYDGDADGVADVNDTCPDSPSVIEIEGVAVQPDWDADGLGDACDDSDFDGVPDLVALQSFAGDTGGMCLAKSNFNLLVPGIVTPSEDEGDTVCDPASLAEIVTTTACNPSCCSSSPLCGGGSKCDVFSTSTWSSACRSVCCLPDASVLSVAAVDQRLVYGGLNRVAVLNPASIVRGLTGARVTTTDVIQDASLGPVWDVQVHAGQVYAATKNGVRRFEIAADGQIAAKGLLVVGSFVRALVVADGWLVFGDRDGITVASLLGIKVATATIAGGVTDLQIIDFDGDGQFRWATDRVYAVGAGPVTGWRVNPTTGGLVSASVVNMNPSGSLWPAATAASWQLSEDFGAVSGLLLPRLRAQNTRLYAGSSSVMSWDQHATSKTNEPIGAAPPLLDDTAAFLGKTLSARGGQLWRRE